MSRRWIPRRGRRRWRRRRRKRRYGRYRRRERWRRRQYGRWNEWRQTRRDGRWPEWRWWWKRRRAWWWAVRYVKRSTDRVKVILAVRAAAHHAITLQLIASLTGILPKPCDRITEHTKRKRLPAQDPAARRVSRCSHFALIFDRVRAARGAAPRTAGTRLRPAHAARDI